MTRTPIRLAVLAVLAVGATGCATFSDNSLAARVTDAELTRHDLEQSLDAAGVIPLSEGRFPADAARTEIDEWVRRQVADQAGLFDRYAAADGSLPIACVYFAPAVDRAGAEAIVTRLEEGESWDDVTASIGPDVQAASRQPCGALTQFPPEVAESLATLVPGGPPVIVDSTEPAASYVLRAHTIEELDLIEFLTAVQSADPLLLDDFVTTLQTADIYVDPRFGTFDRNRFAVAPLG